MELAVESGARGSQFRAGGGEVRRGDRRYPPDLGGSEIGVAGADGKCGHRVYSLAPSGVVIGSLRRSSTAASSVSSGDCGAEAASAAASSSAARGSGGGGSVTCHPARR